MIFFVTVFFPYVDVTTTYAVPGAIALTFPAETVTTAASVEEYLIVEFEGVFVTLI